MKNLLRHRFTGILAASSSRLDEDRPDQWEFIGQGEPGTADVDMDFVNMLRVQRFLGGDDAEG